MTRHASIAHNGRILTVRIPLSIQKRGGRKLMIVPIGIANSPPRTRVDNAVAKALARAYRWRRLLETGVHGTVEELATAEKINPSYVSRILRLTLLAPDIVEAILNGRQPRELSIARLLNRFSGHWPDQRVEFGFA